MSQSTANAPINFDIRVPDNGYAWWYIDAVSDDGKHALTLIAFIGSVFSPYYAWARQRAACNPLDHCAMNVVLYGAGRKRWAMTERTGAAIERSTAHLAIGPSSLSFDGTCLDVALDEVTVPLPSRIRGRLRLVPATITNHDFILDTNGHHHWRPLAPCARIEVNLERPDLRWSGHAYFDSNVGSRPLEADFVYWDWSRSVDPDGTVILYEGLRRDGSTFALAAKAKPSGDLEMLVPPAPVQLGRTGWGLTRRTRAEGEVRVVDTLEDTPFYARSLLQGCWQGQPGLAVHESLCMDRFSKPWVRCLLPFRMPRVAG
ncbi:MAG: hypothetical protein ACO3PV_00330 [Pseudohongiellaceae bacterium]